MITNSDMTIYNQKINLETKLTEYMRTQITGSHWYMEQKTSVDDKGLHSKDVYKIRIPEDAEDGHKVLCDTRRISDDGRCIRRLDNSKWGHFC